METVTKYIVTPFNGERTVKRVKLDKDKNIVRDSKGLITYEDVKVSGGYQVRNPRGDVLVVNTLEDLASIGIKDKDAEIIIDDDGEALPVKYQKGTK